MKIEDALERAINDSNRRIPEGRDIDYAINIILTFLKRYKVDSIKELVEDLNSVKRNESSKRRQDKLYFKRHHKDEVERLAKDACRLIKIDKFASISEFKCHDNSCKKELIFNLGRDMSEDEVVKINNKLYNMFSKGNYKTIAGVMIL